MDRTNSTERNLLISSKIDCDTVKPIINSIISINIEDGEKEKEYKDWTRKPIYLYINSFGGSVYDGLALIDVIKASKTPVYTICIGSCMSMAFWIYITGTKRYIGKNSTLMFHDISQMLNEKGEKIRQALEEIIRLRDMEINEILTRTSIKKTELNDYINRSADWYIPAEKAIALKIADGYY